ncbi:MAG: hypothetical protein DKM50_00500 [Candidatus Margulisiibacteriota bacterium]|nr:MAG: hypothetical protein DKM50_00500 [Candidatus Margulisiibacteriota bacterium]HCT85484.1 hypothetical protein [Candidatus Margulisiibacteriota bacterium]HCY38216.1 hypothetical protein [Candidatus Margulisiibacteriota bacterium]
MLPWRNVRALKYQKLEWAMIEDKTTDVLIIGAGPAGLSAAIYTARANRKTVVLRGKAKSRLEQAHLIENYPGVMSIKGTELLLQFEEQARHFGVEIIETDAIDLGLGFAPKMINTRSGMIIADTVILAMGKGSSKVAIENEEDYIGLGVSYCVVCDGALYKNKVTVVYGNDNDSFEDALMLEQLGCKVTLIVSGKEAQYNSELIAKIKSKDIPCINEARVTKVIGENVLTGIEYEKASEKSVLPANALFIITHGPGSTLLKRAGLEIDATNCIEVNRSQETNLQGVFAAGDIICGGMQIATAVGDGVNAALSCLRYLRAKKT